MSVYRYLEDMDPSMFLQYAPPNGLPQESKLATYMNHSISTPSTSLNQGMEKLSLESSPNSMKKVLIGEFVPINYYPANILPESPGSSPPANLPPMPINPQVHQENVGGTTYFYSTNDSLNAAGALNASAAMAGPEVILGIPCVSAYATQIYATPPAIMGPSTSKQGLAATFYMPETIRAEIYERNEDIYLQPDLLQYPDLPENVETYTDLLPLERASPHTNSTSYRVTHRQSGNNFAIRRIHAYASVPSKNIDVWKQLDHPNIIRLHEYFTTNAFGDHSMVMLYDYHPACTTLMDKFLSGGTTGTVADTNSGYLDPFSSDPDAPRPYTHQKNAMLRAVACGALLPEAVVWSVIVQLTAALRVIHAAGLACRSLDPTKVVMNGCRVRIAWCGIADVTHPNNGMDVGQGQQDDLNALGRIALSLACRNMHCDNLQASMDLVSRTYSADLKSIILYLLSTSTRRSVGDLMPMIGSRFYTQVEALERRADAFEDQLAIEIDNGRLLRLLIKLGIVNERPELNMDTSWAETGDRYMLKLFRDYLFHSVTEDGRPWLDQAHLTHCLNQLDGGTNAKVELMSRDEQSVLVVSYAELKHCLEQAFDEVTAAANGP